MLEYPSFLCFCRFEVGIGPCGDWCSFVHSEVKKEEDGHERIVVPRALEMEGEPPVLLLLKPFLSGTYGIV